MSFLSILLGRRLANREADTRRLGVLEAIPAMGLDGLGSASYGPEAMLTVLAAIGTAGLAAVQPLTWVILALLAILCFSYWQTVAAYPSNGGSYTVARENLGPGAGLLAAAALMIDYMLNVAVGISAGVGALTSALPSLQHLTVPLCLAILAVLTLVNLRGTRESGLALAVPTYLFIATLFFILVAGTWSAATTAGHPRPVIAPPHPAHSAAGAITLWLLLRAFAAGCTAMTGVEAVSNGVGALRDPTVRTAHQTLAAICLVLGVLLAGIAYLAHAYGIEAMDQRAAGYQSVVSQLVGAVWGRGPLYFVTIASVLSVLCLSANTSFVGFPRVCRQVARDGYLPKAFALPGRRLVYTAGIVFLAAGAGALLAAFGGITDRLIPLFAVGAFLSFTLSQAGMAMHWHHQATTGQGRAGVRLLINGAGAIATAMALAIILIAKFTAGAWLTVLVIPLTLVLLRLIRRYYDDLDRQVLEGSHRAPDLGSNAPAAILIPLERWDRMAMRAIRVAARLSTDVTALHLTHLDGPDAERHETDLRQDWSRFVERPAAAAGLNPPRLHIEASDYRSVLAPILREIDAARSTADRPVIVILSELAGGRWWESLLHTGRTRRLRRRILRHGGPDVSVLVVPWQLEPPATARMLADEEPAPA